MGKPKEQEQEEEIVVDIVIAASAAEVKKFIPIVGNSAVFYGKSIVVDQSNSIYIGDADKFVRFDHVKKEVYDQDDNVIPCDMKIIEAICSTYKELCKPPMEEGARL